MTVPFTLRTERMLLRRIEPANIDDLVALDADPLVLRYVHYAEPPTHEEYRTRLLPRMMAYDDQPYGFVAAYEGDDFIGWFHLRPSVADASVLELGYRLLRRVWGRGLATEGARALIRYAFVDLDRTVVDACADPQNVASTRVMEKCGMKREGSFRHPFVPVDVVRYVAHRDSLGI